MASSNTLAGVPRRGGAVLRLRPPPRFRSFVLVAGAACWSSRPESGLRWRRSLSRRANLHRRCTATMAANRSRFGRWFRSFVDAHGEPANDLLQHPVGKTGAVEQGGVEPGSNSVAVSGWMVKCLARPVSSCSRRLPSCLLDVAEEIVLMGKSRRWLVTIFGGGAVSLSARRTIR